MKGIVLHFDFGYSYRSNADVTDPDLRPPAGDDLAGHRRGRSSGSRWAIPVGIISAVKRRSLLDRTTMVTRWRSSRRPVFWLGLVALYLFAQDVGVIPIFPGHRQLRRRRHLHGASVGSHVPALDRARRGHRRRSTPAICARA